MFGLPQSSPSFLRLAPAALALGVSAIPAWAAATPRAWQEAVKAEVSSPGTGILARGGPAKEAAEKKPLRLVVMVSVDQMIPGQLQRLAPQLEGGLGRLVRGGTTYRDARLPYARTETGAGHVTLGTGCIPSTHGVVGNSFWDRELGREVYCVEDLDVHAVRTEGPVPGTVHRSPKNLGRPTLGEILQAKNPASRVVSISGKDRAAIGMVGRSKGSVLWWDKTGTGFQSSTYYTDALPDYVTEWNNGWLDAHAKWIWKPVGNRTAQDFEWVGADVDDRPGERPLAKMGITFPYSFPIDATPATMGGLAFQMPLCDQFVAEMAREALRHEGLGADDDVDLLCVSFSACDVVGHANGPYSREVTDVLFRLDRELGLLFDDLDKRVGKDRWALALTADHGVLPLPEYLRPRGIPAHRITAAEFGAFRGDLVKQLTERLGVKVRNRTAPGGLRLDMKDIEEHKLDPVATRLAAAEVCRELAQTRPWLDTVYSFEEVQAFDGTATGVELLLRNSFSPQRTADLIVVKGIYALSGMELGTSHGTHHDYDRHVPMIFYGPDFPRRVSSRPVGSQDIAPTLLGVLGLLSEDLAFDGRDLGTGR